MTETDGAPDCSHRPETDPAAARHRYVNLDDLRPADGASTCLRSLGLCELGGCCDSCWYRPDHPRFRDPR